MTPRPALAAIKPNDELHILDNDANLLYAIHLPHELQSLAGHINAFCNFVLLQSEKYGLYIHHINKKNINKIASFTTEFSFIQSLDDETVLGDLNRSITVLNVVSGEIILDTGTIYDDFSAEFEYIPINTHQFAVFCGKNNIDIWDIHTKSICDSTSFVIPGITSEDNYSRLELITDHLLYFTTNERYIMFDLNKKRAVFSGITKLSFVVRVDNQIILRGSERHSYFVLNLDTFAMRVLEIPGENVSPRQVGTNTFLSHGGALYFVSLSNGRYKEFSLPLVSARQILPCGNNNLYITGKHTYGLMYDLTHMDSSAFLYSIEHDTLTKRTYYHEIQLLQDSKPKSSWMFSRNIPNYLEIKLFYDVVVLFKE
jgi:5'(3')-deoxyribonucleotidase